MRGRQSLLLVVVIVIIADRTKGSNKRKLVKYERETVTVVGSGDSHHSR